MVPELNGKTNLIDEKYQTLQRARGSNNLKINNNMATDNTLAIKIFKLDFGYF